MRKEIQLFQLNVLAGETENYAMFIDVSRPVRGVVNLKLCKELTIHSLMVGWSSNYHCQELLQSKTRIGKQFYIESIHSLVGEIESTNLHPLQIGEHFFEFEIPNQAHQFENNDNVSKATTLLSWHNLKAALVDKDGVVYYADVTEYNDKIRPTKDATDAVKETSKLVAARNDSSEKANSCPIHRSLSSEACDVSKETAKIINRNLDLLCKLRSPYYNPGDAVSFTVQCRNSSRKRYKHLVASLIERRTNKESKKRSSKSRVAASIIGPAVAPKEIVVWNSQLLSPSFPAEETESWYTLRVELKSRFSSKLVYQVPVVIMNDPLTPM